MILFKDSEISLLTLTSIQGYSVNVPLSKKSREKLCFT